MLDDLPKTPCWKRLACSNVRFLPVSTDPNAGERKHKIVAQCQKDPRPVPRERYPANSHVPHNYRRACKQRRLQLTLYLSDISLTMLLSLFGVVWIASTTRAFLVPSRLSLKTRPLTSIISPWATRLPQGNNKQEQDQDDDKSYDVFLEQQRRRKMLEQCSVFENMPKADMARLVEVMEEVEMDSPDQQVLKQGDKADSMFFVSAGSFECYDEDTGEVLRVCQEGDHFGELSLLFDGGKRAASVRAASPDGKLLQVTKMDFEISVERNKSALQDAVQNQEFYEDFFDDKAKLKALKKCPLFKKITRDDLSRIVSTMKRVEYEAGQDVVTKGEEGGTTMFFVKAGTFECYDPSAPDGKQVVVEYGPGDYFGELALLFDQERALSVRGVGDGPLMLWSLEKEDFIDAIQESPLFQSAIQTLEEKYQTDNIWSVLSKLSPKQLYELASTASRPKKEPVSFHSILSTMTAAFFIVGLLDMFAPGTHDNGMLQIFNIGQYDIGSWHAKMTAVLFACCSVTGLLRLPPNSPLIRRLFFSAATTATVALYIGQDSNAALVENVWTFDLFGPAKYFFWAATVVNVLVSGKFIEESIGGPDTGRNTLPYSGNRFAMVAKGLLFYMGVYVSLPTALFGGDPNEFFSTVMPAIAVTPGLYESTAAAAEATIGFVMLTSTLHFEKKLNDIQYAITNVIMLMLTTNYDAVMSAFDAMTPERATVLAYNSQTIAEKHLVEIVLYPLAFFVARGFWRYFFEYLPSKQPQESSVVAK